VAPRADWTASIIWIAMGALGIAAAVTGLGWRPAEPSFRPATVKQTATPPPEQPAQDLQQAIGQAIRALPPLPAAQRAALEIELSDVRRLATLQPDTSTLAQLTGGSDMLDVSRRPLPVELMPDAASPWSGQAEIRAALAAALRNGSVVAQRDN
jgi:hypothetical protein